MRMDCGFSRRLVQHALSGTFAAAAISLMALAADVPGADVHLFPHALHAAAGTCFPRYNFELWDNDVPHAMAERTPMRTLDGVPECRAEDVNWAALRRYFQTAHGTARDGIDSWQRPRLAVTLEGGGSKSAPFALGALAGLHESGLLNEVDVISSVSGGGYAAYFYFSRLIDAANARGGAGGAAVEAARDPDKWFSDCVPSAYRRRFVEPDAATIYRFCSGDDATSDAIAPFASRYPYQAHIRFYQDVVHWKGGLEEIDASFADRFWTYANVGVLFMQSLVTAPAHFIFSSLLAGADNSSPSRLAYRVGIERAYGHSRGSWGGVTAGNAEPTGGAYAELGYVRSYTMQSLAPIVGADPCAAESIRCRAPLWIANAASSSGRDLANWLTVPATDALRANFEMSPYGQGSGLYGFRNVPVAMTLRDVVGTSAAFFDRDQREVSDGWRRIAAGTAISAFNLEWGTDIPNYNATERARALARVTPVPFYHVASERQRASPMIHLADGGNTDNLGVLAALRRGAYNIIVVASTGDGTGNMESLCRAKNHLELDGAYEVSMPQLVDIDLVCNRQIGEREMIVWGTKTVEALVCVRRKSPDCTPRSDGTLQWNPGTGGPTGYDMWDWPIPVLVGSVRRSAYNNEDGRKIANLYLVKPALHLDSAVVQVVKSGTDENPTRLCDLGREWVIDACTAAEKRNVVENKASGSVAMPCTALAFTIAKSCLAPPHDRHGAFPQHDVTFTTLNSNYTLFGAYYDLARHIVAQIDWDDDELKVPPSLDPARVAIAPSGVRQPKTTGLSAR